MKKRTPKQITQAGATLVTGMMFLPFISLNKKSRWTTSKIKSKERAKI
jgi:hypothetical protein